MDSQFSLCWEFGFQLDILSIFIRIWPYLYSVWICAKFDLRQTFRKVTIACLGMAALLFFLGLFVKQQQPYWLRTVVLWWMYLVCTAFQYIFDNTNTRLGIRMSWDSFLVWFTMLCNVYTCKSGWPYVFVCKNSKTAVEAWQNLCCCCYICETTLPPNYLPCETPSLSFNVLWVAVWRS